MDKLAPVRQWFYPVDFAVNFIFAIPVDTLGYFTMTSVPDPGSVFSAQEIRRIRKWVEIYQNPLLFFLHGRAQKILVEADSVYFRRTGVSETAYYNWLLEEEKRYAALSFTAAPSGAAKTMFHYAEAEQQAAYAAHEAKIIAKAERVERGLPFKGYVARRFGLWSG